MEMPRVTPHARGPRGVGPGAGGGETVPRRRLYVEVESRTDAEGRITPLVVVWRDGVRYHIDRVTEARKAYSPRTCSAGLRYSVCVGGTQTYLFYEGPRWFVEAKVPPASPDAL
jgi:hypothetical protein